MDSGQPQHELVNVGKITRRMGMMHNVQVGQLDGVVNQKRPRQQLEPNLRSVHQAKPLSGREREIRAVEVGNSTQDSPQTITLQVMG